MITRSILILYFLVMGFAVFSQNLTGTWEGTSSSEYCKLVILQINDSCFGYTYDVGFGHCKANYIGSYSQSAKKLEGLNTSFIDKNALHTLSIYNLTYSQKNGSEYLKGIIKPKSAGARIMSLGLGHPIWYKKVSNDVDTTKLMAAKIDYYQNQTVQTKAEKKEEDKQPVKIKDTVLNQIKTQDTPLGKKINTVPDLQTVKASRTSALIKTLQTAADSIHLVLYDNGEIDGDTVTVFYNGTIIYNSVPLSVKPLEITLAVGKGNTTNMIELVANNLGSIPPNTALLLIYAGKERHELRVSSDYSTNARIDILYIDR